MDARRAREEKTYRCFVEDCEKVCSTPNSRRQHAIIKHQFPKNYDFFIVNDGIDKRKTMLRTDHRRRASAGGSASISRARKSGPGKEQQLPPTAMEIDTESAAAPTTTGSENDKQTSTAGTSNVEGFKVDAEMEEITKSMSSLKFVPPSVRFGRGRGRGGLARR
ncbi:hypothetical protein NA57DRAFT_51089 [Rhizodiscina lignyota]|uniref:C2H2-type domain-containing protein n=1 Tax=Rhizodiscina lignyota TaxID=1504668 RepID=A0A9P4INA0_9PEZI|nr:hypothetical protein NA57DRAFT_51089 [Rhizodiscina lignyota]